MLCRKPNIVGIHLPLSMCKVPASSTAPADLNWVSMVVLRAAPSSNNAQLEKYLAGGKPSPSFEPSPLSPIIVKLWTAVGVPRPIINAHLGRKYPQHAWMVGMADPTDSLPPDTVFITGCRYFQPSCPPRVFMTRSPCVLVEHGRMVRTVSTRPKHMTSAQWNWLWDLPFGAVIFSTAGNGVPLPLTIASGDLDGDLYFTCWNTDLLAHVTPRPQRLPQADAASSAGNGEGSGSGVSAEKETGERENWLQEVQRHLVDEHNLADQALIGKLYREMERKQDSSPLGMDNPDAVAYANAYLLALDRPKHGKTVVLPPHLRAAVGLK